MTAMFESINRTEEVQRETAGQVKGTNFSELLFADDTALLADDTDTVQTALTQIERHSRFYGLALNKPKCGVLQLNEHTPIRFGTGEEVNRVTEAVYLGVSLNAAMDVRKEVASRIKACMVVWRKLAPFWKKSSTPQRIKLAVYDTLIRSKLVYGLESAHLNNETRRCITTFQLKGLRQILKLHTTFIDRANTNDRVFQLANKAYNQGRKGGRKYIRPITEFIDTKAQTLLGHILRCADTDPLRQITFLPGSAVPNLYRRKRLGRPKGHWTISQCRRAFESLRDKQVRCPDILPAAEQFDVRNPMHQEALMFGAQHRLF
jgi:hypothetical protein